MALLGNTNAFPTIRTPLPKNNNSTKQYWWPLQPSTENNTTDVQPADVPRHRTFTNIFPGRNDRPGEERDDDNDNGNF